MYLSFSRWTKDGPHFKVEMRLYAYPENLKQNIEKCRRRSDLSEARFGKTTN
jgi:hypothetical protein